MRRLFRAFVVTAGVVYVLLTLVAAFVLPRLLLASSIPRRSVGERAALLESVRPADASWTAATVESPGGARLRLHWLHRPHSHGVAILLHGFGDDGFGTAPRLADLPDWDALVFTFRGRDERPQMPSTLGAWERHDVAAVVHFLERRGVARSDILLVGSSMGAGVALLALADLERAGGPLGGALLESPFEDLSAATRDHLRGTLGNFEWVARPAEWLAIARAGAIGRFDCARVSPRDASVGLRTPIALLTGDADSITPVRGVRAIASRGYPLTVVRGAGHLGAGALVEGGYRSWAAGVLRGWGR